MHKIQASNKKLTLASFLLNSSSGIFFSILRTNLKKKSTPHETLKLGSEAAKVTRNAKWQATMRTKGTRNDKSSTARGNRRRERKEESFARTAVSSSIAPPVFSCVCETKRKEIAHRKSSTYDDVSFFRSFPFISHVTSWSSCADNLV